MEKMERRSNRILILFAGVPQDADHPHQEDTEGLLLAEGKL